MTKKWSEVATSPAFLSLSVDEQDRARRQYFDSVVAPRVDAGGVEAARSQFMAASAPKPIAPTAPAGPAMPPQDTGYFARLGNAAKQFASEGIGSAINGPGEAAVNLVTGMGASAVGGIRGLAKLATGGSMDDAERAIHGTQEALTYQPRTGAGKGAVEIISAPLVALKAGGEYAGGKIGGAVNGEQGRIAGESIGNILPDVAGTLLMGRAGLKAAPSKRDPAQPAAGPQSAGAAVSDQYRMAQAAGASPEILAAIEKAGSNAHPTAAARHAEASSLPVQIELTPGMASGNAALISFEKNNRGKYKEYGERFDRINEQTIANMDEVRAAVAPDVAARGVELGQMAVDAYKVMDDARRADISAKYKALEEANGGLFPLDAAGFAAAADAALTKANRTRFLPAEVRGILDDVRESGAMTFSEFENYRTILAEQGRKTERAGDSTAGYAVNVVRQAMEDMPMVGEAAALKPLADAARSAARERFDAIKADPAYKAAANDRPAAGEPSPLADKFIQSYVVNGKTANVQNMLKNLEVDPLNQQIIAAGVIDHLKSVSGIDLRTNTGNITQKGMNSGIKALDKKAGLLLGAEAAATIETLGNVTRYTMEQTKGTYINNANTAVTQLANGAQSVLMGALDSKTFGLTKGLRGLVEKRRLDKEVQRSMAPGAGINAADFPALLAEMQARSTAVEVPAQVPVTGSRLAERVAEERARKIRSLGAAQSVEEAIRAASGE